MPRRLFPRIIPLIAIVVTIMFSGCAANNGYQKAFSEQTTVPGSKQTFKASTGDTLRAVRQTLVQQGFTIDDAGSSIGVVKAERNMQDSSDKEISYNIKASAYVSKAMVKNESSVTLAASQQTVLHRKWHTWWHLLWILPVLPTGTDYQTVVTKEGNVTDPAFYKDFFTIVGKYIDNRVSKTMK